MSHSISTIQLNQAFERYGSDKSASCHDYAPAYAEILRPFADRPLSLLEVGIYKGSSLAAWSECLPTAKIFGVDYCMENCSPEMQGFLKSKPQITLIEGDINDQSTLATLRELGPFDVIIDDGSHLSGDVISTFNALFFDCLAPGGIYVVEDMAVSYLPRSSLLYRILNVLLGGKTNQERSELAEKVCKSVGVTGRGFSARNHTIHESMKFFKDLADEVNLRGENIYGKQQMADFLQRSGNRVQQHVESVEFRYQLAIARKKNSLLHAELNTPSMESVR